MADFFTDNIAWIATLLVSILVSVVIYFARQNATTVGGTIRLETVQGNVTEIKDDMRNGFDDLKAFIDQRQKENQEEFRRHASRLESLEREGYNLRWRLEQLERRNGGAKAPV